MQKNFLIPSILLALQILGSTAEAHWILKRVRGPDGITPVGVSQQLEKDSRSENILFPKVIKSLPEYLVEHEPSSESIYEELVWPYENLPAAYLKFTFSEVAAVAGSEFRKIVEQGLPENRICLTFVGDGYTEAEKEKFFADVAALTDDLFSGKTFASYKPLFNIYAVYVPSKESGITDLQRKNTAFGLYRSPAGSKRAIMPGNPRAIDQALALAPKTDYPIVIANDEFYGGLGGRYAITSSSRESGKIVLRHELGHNFGGVGEEYDGGSVYSGANSSNSANVPWKHWLKDIQPKIINDMRFLGGAYVWQNLDKKPVVQNFNFPAPNDKGPFWFEVQVSSVGWQDLSDVEILLDGRKLEIMGRGTSDRSFFNTRRIQDLPPGSHQLEVREVNHDGDNILAFANLYAYEADYDFSGATGAFKTYDEGNRITYRPTHENCIMRDMLHESFCPIDQENMWIQFLGKVRLIDEIKVSTEVVSLKAPELGGLQTYWYKKENNQLVEMTNWRNRFDIEKNQFSPGSYVAKVQFANSEVRKTSDSTQDTMPFEIK